MDCLRYKSSKFIAFINFIIIINLLFNCAQCLRFTTENQLNKININNNSNCNTNANTNRTLNAKTDAFNNNKINTNNNNNSNNNNNHYYKYNKSNEDFKSDNYNNINKNTIKFNKSIYKSIANSDNNNNNNNNINIYNNNINDNNQSQLIDDNLIEYQYNNPTVESHSHYKQHHYQNYNDNDNDDENDNGNGDTATLHIDITRKHTINYNGIEINENSLVHHLEDHEKDLIFGKSKKPRNIKLVHLQRQQKAATSRYEDNANGNGNDNVNDDLSSSTTTEGIVTEAYKNHKRSRRSLQEAPSSSSSSFPTETTTTTTTMTNQKHSTSHHEVSVQIKDNNDLVNLKLHQTPKLIDDAFVLIRRYANSTQFIEDSHKIAAEYEKCFYSNDRASLDLCDNDNVRGLFHHNSTDFIIQPLPSRFGNSTHIIIETDRLRPDARHIEKILDAKESRLKFEKNMQFEPDEADFNDLNPIDFSENEDDDDDDEDNESVQYSRPIRNVVLEKVNKSNNVSHHHENNQHHEHNSLHRNKSKSSTLNRHYQPRYTNDEKHYKHRRRKRQPALNLLHQNTQTTDFDPHHQQHHKSESNQHQQHSTKHHQRHQKHEQHRRKRRYISASGSQWRIPQVLHIETAIFVDSDLFRHMAKNFPKDTESHLIRFVLAMINGVQLLYHHPSLGHRINFVLKRLEILYKDPKDLQRSSDIDIYLSNFCLWQKSLNPPSDADTVHYDHAVILTGLDLYVVGKNGKVISQVVGLAPVAGMCTATSSCTINEGKHFESVFVVAHEIGHNLGMRHDTNENSCDPSLYIMSPTLGSGKITWSKCSRTYLNTFLETNQAKCLFDRGQFVSKLDHSAEGLMPGQRFGADQQCMLKYGRDSIRARNQMLSDICRDLHCQRDRYTWTSHPALEGTECGADMWCRSGVCSSKPNLKESNNIIRDENIIGKPGYDKSNFLESSKMGHLLYEYNHNKMAMWSQWSEASDCDSGCLYGPSKRLREGSTGLKTYHRSCLDQRRRCMGRDRKFESCIARQCYSIEITTINDFSRQVCEKAQKFDNELTGEGEQIMGDAEESCKIFCRTKTNGTKSRSWTFPDGTTCRSKHYNFDDTAYCIAGRCERFSCDNTTSNYYKIDPIFCRYWQTPASSAVSSTASPLTTMKSITAISTLAPVALSAVERNENPNRQNDVYHNYYNYNSTMNRNNYNYNDINKNYNNNNNNNNNIQESSRTNNRYAEREMSEDHHWNRLYPVTTARNRYENEVAVRSLHSQSREYPNKHKSETHVTPWNKYNYHFNDNYETPSAATSAPSLQQQQQQHQHQQPQQHHQSALPPVAASLIAAPPESEWIVKSGCHSSCMSKSKGIQVVMSRRTGENNIQLCTHTIKPCDHLLTASEYAENTCSRYKLKVRGLSGYGAQIAASVDEPDRSCRVGCQDEFIKYRFYLVNGKYGHFPLGTKCSSVEDRYCVNGKCLEFGSDNIPLQQSHINLAQFRERRSLETNALDYGNNSVTRRQHANAQTKGKRRRRRHRRQKRSYLSYDPVNITETVTQELINSIVDSIMNTERQNVIDDDQASKDHIEFMNPIHISPDEMSSD